MPQIFAVKKRQVDANAHCSGGEVGQPLEVDELVFGGALKNGFFLEAGSTDAELDSNTLHFEINHGWTGLLGRSIYTFLLYYNNTIILILINEQDGYIVSFKRKIGVCS